MSMWKVLQGNTSIQDILIKDKDGKAVTNLDAAQEIKFVVKEKRTDAVAKIEKTKGDGIEVLTGDDLGKLRITLLPTDTKDLPEKLYLMALQIKWSDTLIYEIILSFDGTPTNQFWILNDMIS